MVRSQYFTAQLGLNQMGASMNEQKAKEVQKVKDEAIMELYRQQLQNESDTKTQDRLIKQQTVDINKKNLENLAADRKEKNALEYQKIITKAEADSKAFNEKNKQFYTGIASKEKIAALAQLGANNRLTYAQKEQTKRALNSKSAASITQQLAAHNAEMKALAAKYDAVIHSPNFSSWKNEEGGGFFGGEAKTGLETAIMSDPTLAKYPEARAIVLKNAAQYAKDNYDQ